MSRRTELSRSSTWVTGNCCHSTNETIAGSSPGSFDILGNFSAGPSNLLGLLWGSPGGRRTRDQLITLRDQWFFRNSVPEVVITDNASYFLSREFRNLLQRFDIRHWLNSKYHSQANPVERVHRTINTAIRTYVREDQRLWDCKISEIETILNTSLHSATELTPYFTTHGYEMMVKGSDHHHSPSEAALSPEERSERQKETYGKVCDLVKENLAKAHTDCKKKYDLRHRSFGKEFQVGQLVFHRNMKLSSAPDHYNAKYGPQYLPARVIRKKGTSSYEIEDLNGKSLGVWPAAHLKPG